MKTNQRTRNWRNSFRAPVLLFTGAILLTEQVLGVRISMGAELSQKKEEKFDGAMIAVDALENLRKLMVSGNTIYRDRFIQAFERIPQGNAARKDFVTAFNEGMFGDTGFFKDAKYGPLFKLYVDKKDPAGRDFKPKEFVEALVDVHQTLRRNIPADIEAKKADWTPEGASSNFAEGLAATGVRVEVPTFVTAVADIRTQTQPELLAAQRAAVQVGDLFVAFIGEKDEAKQREAANRFLGAINESNEWFADAFELYLRANHPQYWKVYEQYKTEAKEPNYKEFCDKVIRTANSLHIDLPAPLRAKLEDKEGKKFVDELDKIVALTTRKPFNLARERQVLSDRLAQVRKFLIDNRLMGENPEEEVGSKVAETYVQLTKDIQAANDEGKIIVLRKSIPTVDLLKIAQEQIARYSERVTAVLTGRTGKGSNFESGAVIDFYQSFSTYFVSRLTSLDAQAADIARLNTTSPLFQQVAGALLLAGDFSPDRSVGIQNFVLALRQAQELMATKTAVYEQALRNQALAGSPEEMAAAALDFKSMESVLDSITDKLAVLLKITDKSQKQRLRLEVERRFMAQYVVVSGTSPLSKKGELLDRFIDERQKAAKDTAFHQFANGFTNDIRNYQGQLGVTSLSPTDQLAEERRRTGAEDAYRSTDPRTLAGASGTSPAALGTLADDSKRTVEERNLRASQRIIAQQALDRFAALPAEYKYAIFDVLTATYQGNLRGAFASEIEMPKICALIVSFAPRDGFPGAYASGLVREIGETLLGNKTDYEIVKAGGVAIPAITRFTNGGFYHLAGQMYAQIPRRLNRATTRMAAYRYEMRDQGDQFSVLVRLPVDDKAYNLGGNRPFQLEIDMPKSIYRRPDVKDAAIIGRPADIQTGPYSTDPLATLERFKGPVVQLRTILPHPSIRGPVWDAALVEAFADFPFPPVGEYLALTGNLGLSGNVYTVKGVDSDDPTKRKESSTTGGGSLNAGLNVQREGLTTTSTARYEVLVADPSAKGQTQHAADFTLNNLRSQNGGYQVNQAIANLRVNGSTLENLALLFSGSAPKGVDQIIYFQRRENPSKAAGAVDSYYEMNILARLPNGSFFLANSITMPKEVANSLYQAAFKDPMQRLYGGMNIQGKSGSSFMLDGAVLMSGSYIGVNEQKTGTDGALVAKDSEETARFQGVGGLLQVGKWGGLVDVEGTRGWRAQAAFGSFDSANPQNRRIWYGRVVLNNMSQISNDASKGGYYGEFRFLESNHFEARAFAGYDNGQWSGVGLLNWRWDQPILGPLRIKYAGVVGGRSVTTSADLASRVDTRGASAFMINQDMLNGLVFSTIRRTTIAKDTGTGLGNATDQMTYAAGLRWYIRKSLSIEGGVIWDNLTSTTNADSEGNPTASSVQTIVNTGAAGAKIEWVINERAMLGGKFALIANNGQMIPIGVATLTARTSRTSVVSFEGGYSFGEFQLRTPRFHLVLGGGVLYDINSNEAVASGGHGALIFRRTNSTIALLGSRSVHLLPDEMRTRLTSAEGMLVGTYNLSSGSGRWESATAFWYASGIYQEREQRTAGMGGMAMPGTETRQAFQGDLGLGMRYYSMVEQLTVSMTAQAWSASASAQDGEDKSRLVPDWDKKSASGRLQLTANYTALGSVKVGRFTLYRPNLLGTAAIGGTETPTDRRVNLDLRFTLSGGF